MMLSPCICFSISGYSMMFFFFFSSRRRHTRCYRDWSSDVCSSDLEKPRRTYTAIFRNRLTSTPRQHVCTTRNVIVDLRFFYEINNTLVLGHDLSERHAKALVMSCDCHRSTGSPVLV